MVDTETVDVYVRENELVEVHRYRDAVLVQRFGCTVDYLPNFFRTKPSKSTRIADWVIPACFVAGVIFAAWAVLR